MKNVIDTVLRGAVAPSVPRWMLNAIYDRMSFSQKSVLYNHFAKIFRNRHGIAGGAWTATFLSRRIQLPLRPGHMWLDWDCALSMLGHEAEIKATYASLLASPNRPDLFVDVGANYGLHSLLFLAHGVKTVSFEPNHLCRDYFFLACALNGVKPHWEELALAEKAGHVDLRYPATETWLGSTDEKASSMLEGTRPLVTQRVAQTTLDAYLSGIKPAHLLVKLDTEGSEYRVLLGARRVLEELQPRLIFESWPDGMRARLLEVLSGAGYEIFRLPWVPGASAVPLRIQEFLESADINFITMAAGTT